MKFAKLKKINGSLECVECNDIRLEGLVYFLTWALNNDLAYEFCVPWLKGTAQYSKQHSIYFNSACLLKYNKKIYVRFYQESKLKDCFSATSEEMLQILWDWVHADAEYKQNKKGGILITQNDNGKIEFRVED